MTYEYVHGAETELDKLAEFPAKVEKNVMRGAVRAAASVVKDGVAALIPRATGALADTLRISSRVRSGEVSATVKVGNPKKGVFYAGFVMGGTKPHLIKGRVTGWLGFGGVVRRVVQHPGAKAQPFMDQANLATRDAALKAAFDYADDRLTQLLTDQGNK